MTAGESAQTAMLHSGGQRKVSNAIDKGSSTKGVVLKEKGSPSKGLGESARGLYRSMKSLWKKHPGDAFGSKASPSGQAFGPPSGV